MPFHGTTITALRDGDEVQVAIRPVCDSLGLNFDGQRRRLEHQPWATIVAMTTVGADGKTRDMLTVDRRTFTMWLATIDTSRIKNEQARELIALFQREQEAANSAQEQLRSLAAQLEGHLPRLRGLPQATDEHLTGEAQC